MLRRADKTRSAARALYLALTIRARSPVFHSGFLVPDTIDGRFDLLALHAFLVMQALKSQGSAGAKLGGELADVIFLGFDEALRELGVGDLGLSRRIKAMANAFYGRLEAYGGAQSEEALAAVLFRNLYRGNDERSREAARLAPYIMRARRHLSEHGVELLQGNIDFGPLPECEPLA
jgi:cytochrome b pre-mRNA-processing protein 3